MTDYPPPVSRLLTLGKPDRTTPDWLDYPALGIGLEHVPDLIRMVTDEELKRLDGDRPEVWGPLHAWRTLGKLRAREAARPLLDYLVVADENDDDWGMEEIPEVLAMMGPEVLPDVMAALSDSDRPIYARIATAEAIKLIARKHPERRDECLALYIQLLEEAGENDPSFNGFLIADLLDLGAVEAAPAIERAFAGEDVDESIAGDWPHVRYELGLGEKPPPRRFTDPGLTTITTGLLDALSSARPNTREPLKAIKQQARAKRKQARASKKKNRKR